MKKRLLITIGLFVCLFATAETKKKKAVFVIVDGIPADVIERVSTPIIDEISSIGGYTRAYVGGDTGEATETPTVSSDGYMDLITATWGNKHNIINNNIDTPNYNYWNIFRIAKNQPFDVKTAVFSSWLENRTVLIGEGLSAAGNIYIDEALDGLERDKDRFPDEQYAMHIFKVDEEITKGAAACILEKAPDLMWVYLWYMDCVGHEFGDGERYDKYTKITDDQIGSIWEAVKEREKNHNEEWMVVITTDHGRTAKDGKDHGDQSERERTTWISTNKKVNDYYKRQQPGIVDITSSICRYLGYAIPEDVSYEQEGIPFIGKVDFSNLKAENKDGLIELTWENYTNNPLDIYVSTTNHFKTGGTDKWTHIGKVPAKKRKFMYNPTGNESAFYKFSVRGKNNSMPVWIIEK